MAETEVVDNTDNAGEDFFIGPFEIDTIGNDRINRWVSLHENAFNVSVTVTAQVTTDNRGDFSTFAVDSTIADAESISSGGNTLGIEDDQPWSYVRFLVSPGGDPTSGSYTCDFQSRGEA